MLPTLSLELHWKIMMHLCYKDTLNYIRANYSIISIYNNSSFWKAKLNYNFTIWSDDGKWLIPSIYVSEPCTATSYERWELYAKKLIGVDIITDNQDYFTLNTDIILWRIDESPDTFPEYYKTILFLALKYGNIKLLDCLFNKGYKLDKYDIDNELYDIAHYTNTQGLDWLTHHIELPYDDLINIVIKYQNTHIMDWLIIKHIPINSHYARNELINNKLFMLQWLAIYKIYPSQDDIDIYFEIIKPEILTWLSTHGIKPNMKAVQFYKYTR